MKNLKFIYVLLLSMLISFVSCNKDDSSIITKEELIGIQFNQEKENSLLKKALLHPIPVVVHDYKHGYVIGYTEINAEKKIAMILNPRWGINIYLNYYAIDYEKPFGIGKKVATPFGNYDDSNGGYKDADDGTVEIVRARFDEQTFNIVFHSSTGFQNKINYLYDRKNNSPAPYDQNYWQGLIDGNIHGIWGLNAYS